MQRTDFRFFHRLRVRWAEVDLQKIVFNPHYLMYFDTAIADYWRALALPYESGMHELGGDLYARKATVEFHASARLDDVLDIGIRRERVGNTSMLFQGAMFRRQELLITCEMVYVFADPATQTPKPVPPALRDMFDGFESGEPMVEVLTGDWQTLGEGAAALRRTVFIEEQRIPEAEEWDANDKVAVHAVVRNRIGQTIATGRLLPESEPGLARIGRVAAHPVMRNGGYGGQAVQALEQVARARGDRAVTLSAQHEAMRFYDKLGYLPHGAPFVEAGIPHQEMRKAL